MSESFRRLDIPMGFSIDTLKWDPESQRVKKNAYSKKKESYSDIYAKAFCSNSLYLSR